MCRKCPECDSEDSVVEILMDGRQEPHLFAYYCEYCGYCWARVGLE